MNKEQISKLIHDYHWMVALLVDERKQLLSSLGMVAQGGIESAMPKGQGNHSDPIYNEVIRMEKEQKHYDKIRQKVLFIQNRIDHIHNDKDRSVLAYMLQGQSYTEISVRLNMSVDEVRGCKRRIVKALHNAHESHNSQKVAN